MPTDVSRSSGDSSQGQSRTQSPRLLYRLRSVLHERRYHWKTAERMVEWFRQCILFHGKRHPQEMGYAEIAQFLHHLADVQHLAASWQREAREALGFSSFMSARDNLPAVATRASRCRGC